LSKVNIKQKPSRGWLSIQGSIGHEPLKSIGVPKGISFDDAQDKLTPVVPLKAGCPWPEYEIRTISRQTTKIKGLAKLLTP